MEPNEVKNMLAPAARNSDPETSHIAEKEITTSGRRAVQMMRVVDEVKKLIGFTSAELAKATGIDYHVIARRLPDARSLNFVKNGESRKCKETGRKALTWYPV